MMESLAKWHCRHCLLLCCRVHVMERKIESSFWKKWTEDGGATPDFLSCFFANSSLALGRQDGNQHSQFMPSIRYVNFRPEMANKTAFPFSARLVSSRLVAFSSSFTPEMDNPFEGNRNERERMAAVACKRPPLLTMTTTTEDTT